MAVQSAAVNVTTTATLLSGTDADAIAGENVAVSVASGGLTVYLGGPGVTSANGFPVNAGTQVSVPLITPKSAELTAEALYGIIASGGPQEVRVLRTGV